MLVSMFFDFFLQIFDLVFWMMVEGFDFMDIMYYVLFDKKMVCVVFDWFEVCNVFWLYMVDEFYWVFDYVCMWSSVGCVLIIGNGFLFKDGGWVFCLGGD